MNVIERRSGTDKSLGTEHFFAVERAIWSAELNVSLVRELTQFRVESHGFRSVRKLHSASLPRDDPVNDTAHPHFDFASVAPMVLHEEPEWFIVNKPIGWHSVATRVTDGAPTIQEWVGAQRPSQRELPECGMVHRLDHSTSGCLLVAKSALSHEDLRENFSAGKRGWAIGKKYLALVTAGTAPTGEFALYFSSRHKGSTKVTVRDVGDRNEKGVCRWHLVRSADRRAQPFDPRAFDLIEVDLIGPGRRHQIRAGLASLGHPLAGDGLYRGSGLAEEWNHNFTALHASTLIVTEVRVESPRPSWATDGADGRDHPPAAGRSTG